MPTSRSKLGFLNAAAAPGPMGLFSRRTPSIERAQSCLRERRATATPPIATLINAAAEVSP
ncbi:MAG: hypothetical protein KDB31_04110, partial [Microthrixaceae bacterium]|nr:hypothetical protein [Microthrixaceae bacterium]